MRTLRWLAAAVIVGGVACSNTQNGGGAGAGGAGVDAGSGTGSVDAGTAGGGGPADAGTSDGGSSNAGGGGGVGSGGGAGSADAGTGGTGGGGSGGAGGGSADAGTGSGGGGSADGGAGGGGTTSADCSGLEPGALPAMVTFQTFIDSAQNDVCGLPIGDSFGAMALRTNSGFHPKWLTVSPAGEQTGSFGAWQGEFFPNRSGFIGYVSSSVEQVVAIQSVDARGNVLNSTPIRGDTGVFAMDPSGGLFAVGHLTRAPEGSGPPPKTMVAAMFNADATLRWGPTPLGIVDSAVFGAGVDLGGHAVVIYDGGGGNIDAIWVGTNGLPGTAPFTVLTSFQPGPSTWFETSPLIGGGVALRRMDAPAATSEHRTSAWVAVLPSMTARADAPPQWLTDRPNTDMELARSGRAYAFLPWSTDVSPCDQAVEIVSPGGNSCGKADFSVDANACQTRDLHLAGDGTVMQMAPASREHFAPGSSVVTTCTLRFWPAALR